MYNITEIGTVGSKKGKLSTHFLITLSVEFFVDKFEHCDCSSNLPDYQYSRYTYRCVVIAISRNIYQRTSAVYFLM